MSLNRYAKRCDGNQEDIVKALRKAGCVVEIINKPVDLLVYWAGLFTAMEVKRSPKEKLTPAQQKYIAKTKCPVVTSPEEALRAIGII